MSAIRLLILPPSTNKIAFLKGKKWSFSYCCSYLTYLYDPWGHCEKLYLSPSNLGISRGKGKALGKSKAMCQNPSLAKAKVYSKASAQRPRNLLTQLHKNGKGIHFSLFSVCLDGLSLCFRPWRRIGSRLFFGIGLGWLSLSMNAEWISQHDTRELYVVADTTLQMRR